MPRDKRVELAAEDSLATILGVHGKNPKKLRAIWQNFVDQHSQLPEHERNGPGAAVLVAVARGLQVRLNELEGNLPGLQRGDLAQKEVR